MVAWFSTRRAAFLAIQLALLALLGVAFAACTQVRADEDANLRTLSIEGKGEVHGAPDIARLDRGVSLIRDSVTEARAAAAEAMTAVRDALAHGGVAAEDIATSTFGVYPEYDYAAEGRFFIGYRVNNNVVATIRQVDGATTVIDAAIEAAGDDVVVNGIRFLIEDESPLVDAARQLAVAEARRKAENLAELSGVRLGAVISIGESRFVEPPVYYEGAGGMGGGNGSPISGGQIAVALQVHVTYDIE